MSEDTTLMDNAVVRLTVARHKDPLEVPLKQMLLAVMKPAGIFVESTQGNLEYHRQILEELTAKVKASETYSPQHTFEQTVDLLAQCQAQVTLCETIQKHFIDEAPLPFFFDHELKALEVVTP